MKNLELLEVIQSELSHVKRLVKKGEIVIKGENRDSITHDYMDKFARYNLTYEVNEFNSMNVIVFTERQETPKAEDIQE